MASSPRNDATAQSSPPRTVVVSSAHILAPGGLSVYARHVAEWLASEHGSAIAVARFVRTGVPFRAYAYRERPRTMRTSSGVEIRIIAPPGAIVPGLRLLNRTIDRRSLDWFTTSVVTLAFARALEQAIPRDAGVVHYVGSAWELLGFAALRVARKRGIAFTTCQGMHPGEWGDGPLDARLLSACDLIFALSAHEAARLEELGIARDRVLQTPLGPAASADGDASRFRGEHHLGAAPTILFVGRKQSYKGYDAVVAALTIVRREIPEARLVVIGSGPAREDRPDGLLELGEVDDDAKADALAACDVFCMPSSGESFGIVYVEAWAYGKPVVVGTAPAARELVEDGRTGLHADHDPDRLARALVELLSDPAHARRLGEAGRRLQVERYTWQAAWDVHSAGLTAAHERALQAASPGR